MLTRFSRYTPKKACTSQLNPHLRQCTATQKAKPQDYQSCQAYNQSISPPRGGNTVVLLRLALCAWARRINFPSLQIAPNAKISPSQPKPALHIKSRRCCCSAKYHILWPVSSWMRVRTGAAPRSDSRTTISSMAMRSVLPTTGSASSPAAQGPQIEDGTEVVGSIDHPMRFRCHTSPIMWVAQAAVGMALKTQACHSGPPTGLPPAPLRKDNVL